MITKKMVLDACTMCKEASIEVDPVLAALKAEAELNNQDQVLKSQQESLSLALRDGMQCCLEWPNTLQRRGA
jgi:hypothetical protein